MIAVVPGRGRWRLVGRTGRGADLLAVGPLAENPDADRPSWQRALELLRDGHGELVVTAPDGRHYRWELRDPSGSALIARSPAVHRDAGQCRDAFDTARRAADSALADHHHPGVDTRLSDQDHPLADATTG